MYNYPALGLNGAEHFIGNARRHHALLTVLSGIRSQREKFAKTHVTDWREESRTGHFSGISQSLTDAWAYL